MATDIEAFRPAAQAVVAYIAGLSFSEGARLKLGAFTLAPGQLPIGIMGIAINLAH